MPLKVNIKEKMRLCTYIHAVFKISLTLDKPANITTEHLAWLVFSCYSFATWIKGKKEITYQGTVLTLFI